MTKRSLVVGIDAYEAPNALPSCVADAQGFAALLQTRYAFDDVTVLLDKDATKAEIVAALTALVGDVATTDRIVFYYSGHGYSFQKDDATLEALVAQDAQFLDSRELKALVAGVPPGTFTVVLDSCFSGGMEKLFLVPGKGVATAKVKRWIPSSSRGLEADLAPVGVTRYEAFGFSSHPSSASLARVFGEPTNKAFSIVAPPRSDAGGDDRPFLLVSACKPDETAAASVEGRTAGRSAFTFCLLDRIDRSTAPLSAVDLLAGVGQQLHDLALRQTPVLKEPADPPRLGAKAFPTLGDDAAASEPDAVSTEPVGQVPAPIQSNAQHAPDHLSLLVAQTISDGIRSGTMVLLQNNVTSELAAAAGDVVASGGSSSSGLIGPLGDPGLIAQVTPIVIAALKTITSQTDAQKAYQSRSNGNGQTTPLSSRGKLAAAITPIVSATLVTYQPQQQSLAKGYSQPQAADKTWLTSIVNIIADVAPVIIDALKTYQPPPGTQKSFALTNIQTAAQKGFFDDLTRVVATAPPAVIDALKEYQPPPSATKGLFDDVLTDVAAAARIAAPIVLAAL